MFLGHGALGLSNVTSVTQETSDLDPTHDSARVVVAQMARSLSVAVATAAATVVVVAWVGTWEDVEEVGLAHYLF